MTDTELLCVVVVLSTLTQAATAYLVWRVCQRMTEALARIGNCRPGRARSGVVQRQRDV
ncbi:MAG TPA: hypothetical protein VKR06_46395 [Ktedonosporobacter sp.]|nr:hypothetical protein [Ktedonosporobacter sp.]